MLVLTRSINRSIVIGDGDTKIEVVVLGINGGQVKLGVKAPDSVDVHRDEIYKRIQEQKAYANSSR
ncbi:carbon storage regulator CsrA [Arsukibacterium sp.]|uniref:carbon storage regulator CsrA n=1 Tax=Arsukibacterium sp. TaxID=1977258 RepID=UPI002FDA6D1D